MPPINDDFADAVDLTSLTSPYSADNTGATSESPDPLFDAGFGSKTVWFKIGPFIEDKSFDIWTSNGTGLTDTVLGVYEGSSLGTLTSLVQNDDASGVHTTGTYSEIIALQLVAGVVYYIELTGYSEGYVGSCDLSWLVTTYVPPPPLSANPIVMRGDTVTSGVQAANGAKAFGPSTITVFPDNDNTYWEGRFCYGIEWSRKYKPGKWIAQIDPGAGMEFWTGSPIGDFETKEIFIDPSEFSQGGATLPAYDGWGTATPWTEKEDRILVPIHYKRPYERKDGGNFFGNFPHPDDDLLDDFNRANTWLVDPPWKSPTAVPGSPPNSYFYVHNNRFSVAPGASGGGIPFVATYDAIGPFENSECFATVVNWPQPVALGCRLNGFSSQSGPQTGMVALFATYIISGVPTPGVRFFRVTSLGTIYDDMGVAPRAISSISNGDILGFRVNTDPFFGGYVWTAYKNGQAIIQLNSGTFGLEATGYLGLGTSGLSSNSEIADGFSGGEIVPYGLFSPYNLRVYDSLTETGTDVVDVDDFPDDERFSTNYGVSWKPDASKLMFARRQDDPPNDERFYQVNSDGTGIVDLTSTLNSQGITLVHPFIGPFGESEHRQFQVFVWNPDGSDQIIFVGSGLSLSPYAIWSITEAGVATNLFESADPQVSNQSVPSFSPDGSKIAFAVVSNTGVYDIYVMNKDGTGAINVTTGLSLIADDIIFTRIVWSPDSTKLLFASGNESSHLSIVQADGSSGEEIYAGIAINGQTDLEFNDLDWITLAAGRIWFFKDGEWHQVGDPSNTDELWQYKDGTWRMAKDRDTDTVWSYVSSDPEPWQKA